MPNDQPCNLMSLQRWSKCLFETGADFCQGLQVARYRRSGKCLRICDACVEALELDPFDKLLLEERSLGELHRMEIKKANLV
jgi:hypothetical protein